MASEIDWALFLKAEFPNGKIIYGRNGKELNIDCIADDCPSPKEHMFVNIQSDDQTHDKKFICHRCGFAGNHKAFLMAYYKVTYSEVLEYQQDIYGKEGDALSETQRMAQNIKGDTLKTILYDKKAEGFVIDLPNSFRYLRKQTEYLKTRNIPSRVIKQFKIGRAIYGFYKNRLIFPVETNKNRSFLAYSQYSRKALAKFKVLYKENPDNFELKTKKKKILNPKKSLHSMLLYNYNKVKKNEDIVFVHEGAFDCIRTVMNEHVPVGIFSKYLSVYQAELLADKEPDEICIMLDADATTEDIIKIMKTLKDHCDCPISYIRLKKVIQTT